MKAARALPFERRISKLHGATKFRFALLHFALSGVRLELCEMTRIISLAQCFILSEIADVVELRLDRQARSTSAAGCSHRRLEGSITCPDGILSGLAGLACAPAPREEVDQVVAYPIPHGGLGLRGRRWTLLPSRLWLLLGQGVC